MPSITPMPSQGCQGARGCLQGGRAAAGGHPHHAAQPLGELGRGQISEQQQ